MRRLAPFFLLCLPALSACQQAAAATNQEMAHCVAAFHFGRQHWLNQSPPNYQALVPLTAGAIYYIGKLKDAGVADGGQAEAVAFAVKNHGDPQLMMKTLQDCGRKQLADPEFRDRFAALTRLAMQADPVCKPDPSLCAKR